MSASEEQQVGMARVLATMAHQGQVDKAGQPYIGHPRRVVQRLAGAPWEVRAAAWLHDVLEDTPMTAVDLLELGIAPETVEAVELLTRVEGVSKDSYYSGIRGNETALRVKLADIADNTDPRRLALLDDDTVVRLVRKYAYALESLEQGL